MRRSERRLPEAKVKELLKSGEWGVLSLTDRGTPYGIPLNYVFDEEENAIYFHSAPEGRKIAAIGAGARAAFTVVGLAEVIPAQYTTAYRSVMCAGRVTVVMDRKTRFDALYRLCEKYVPGGKNYEKVIESYDERVAVVKFEIESASGKHNRA